MTLIDLFPVILLAVLVAALASPLAIIIARRFGLVDIPGRRAHKQHAVPTPMAGGLVVVLTLLVDTLWFQRISDRMIAGVLGGAIVVFAFGLWDDFAGLGAPQKFAGQLLAAGILIVTGTQVRIFTSNWPNLALTFFWVLGVVNAFNFVDSMDGLALGLAGVAAAFFMLVAIESDQIELAMLSAGVLGLSIGAYFYNLNPAKMFLGDSGSQQLGFLLAAIGLAYSPPDLPILSSWFVPIMVLGVPIFDMALVVVSRGRRGVAIYKGAWDHTYHRLCMLGMQPTRAVFAMHLMAMVLGLASFIALEAGALVGNSIFILSLIMGIVLIAFFEYRER